MKAFFSKRTWLWLFALLLVQSCKKTTVSDILGTWGRSHDGIIENITFNGSGEFEQTVVSPIGGKKSITESWTLHGEVIILSRFLQTFDEVSGKPLDPPRLVYSSPLVMDGKYLRTVELDPYLFARTASNANSTNK